MNNASRPKASRVLGTQLDAATESFNSPVELGDILHHSKPFVTRDVDLNDPHDDLGEIKIEVATARNVT